MVRNDQATVDELLTRRADRLIVSPGPCTPAEAGISGEAIRRFAEAGTPVLGVCLGHQALAATFGGTVVRGEPVHGKTAVIEHDGRTIFDGLEPELTVGRYHSLIVDPDLPGRAGGVGPLRRHDHGPAPPRAAGRGRAVPPRIRADRARHGHTAQLPAVSDAPNPILTETIDRLCRSEALTVDETSAVLHEVMEGRASEVQTAALLIAFRAKGETVGELAGMARAMRDLAVPVATDRPGLVDTAGTGGGRPTFNVSTTAAFVAAGAGVPMAKHGNRSATGRSGSADVLEALGARIDLAPEEVAGVHRRDRLRLHVRARATTRP